MYLYFFNFNQIARKKSIRKVFEILLNIICNSILLELFLVKISIMILVIKLKN